MGHPDAALLALRGWALEQGHADLCALCDRYAQEAPVARWHALSGPTGESDLYAVLPREAVLCLAQGSPLNDACLLQQLAAVLAVGSRAVWSGDCQLLWQALPSLAKDRVTLVRDWRLDPIVFSVVLHHGEPADLLVVCRVVASRAGPVVEVVEVRASASEAHIPLERLMLERSLSINIAAAGGNASLMTMG